MYQNLNKNKRGSRKKRIKLGKQIDGREEIAIKSNTEDLVEQQKQQQQQEKLE